MKWAAQVEFIEVALELRRIYEDDKYGEQLWSDIV